MTEFAKIPKTQTFNGKRYTYLGYEDVKRDAEQRAKSIRSLGSKARVTKETSPLGKKYYAIWTKR